MVRLLSWAAKLGAGTVVTLNRTECEVDFLWDVENQLFLAGA